MSGKEEEECEQLSQFERNKYFYGKLLTVRDFETEQRYFNEKRHLLNRLIHGIGLVCGLEVSEPRMDGGTLKIKLSPGVALDCCGHEIVVGKDFGGKGLDVSGTVTRERPAIRQGVSGKELDVSGTVTDGPNYIYLKYAECEKEPCPALANTSTCEEACCYNRYEEIFELVLDKPPQVTGEVESAPKSAQEYYEEHLTLCPECEDAKVLLAVIKKNETTLTIDETATNNYRAIVYNNPMLYELINSHLSDFENPHNVTAEQTGALKSIEDLENPGGNIDIDKEDEITIRTETPPGGDPTIIIGEKHSGNFNNPHKVTALQVGALVSIDGVSNPGGDVDLVAGNSGKNIAISPKEPNHTSITIDLATALQAQLNTVFQYLRERALKCTVINFKEVGKKFENKAAGELSLLAKGAVDDRAYEDKDEFMTTIRSIFKMEKEIAKEIRKLATEESLKDFLTSLDYLDKALDSKDKERLHVATAQDEVCFFALLLEKKPLEKPVDFSPVINPEIPEKVTPEVVRGMDPVTKDELTKTKTALILNEVYRNPDIKTKELAERIGMTVKSVESTVSTLVKGNILSGTDTKGYRLKIE